MPVLVAAGCSPTAPPGNAELGIKRFEITEDGTGLAIRGVRDDGAMVAEVTVRLGHVEVPETDEAGPGRTVALVMGTDRVERVLVGFAPSALHVPRYTPTAMTAFLLDPVVEDALARWNLRVEDLAAEVSGDELGYAACASSGCSSSSTVECCENNSKFEYRICSANTAQLAERHCPGIPSCPGGGTYPSCVGAPTCPSGSQSCNTNRCCSTPLGSELGAAGCAVSWTYTNTGGTWDLTDSGAACAWNECGAFSEPCCNGTTCSSGLSCASETCCKNNGTSCSNNSECCTGICDLGTCASCRPNLSYCTGDEECCSGNCDQNTCYDCIGDYQYGCVESTDCCSPHQPMVCDNGTCVPP